MKKRPVFCCPEEDPQDRIPIRTPVPFLEALETRLEAGFLMPNFPHASSGHPVVPSCDEDTCGCRGTLCNCDGHDCVGICDLHCVLDYT